MAPCPAWDSRKPPLMPKPNQKKNLSNMGMGKSKQDYTDQNTNPENPVTATETVATSQETQHFQEENRTSNVSSSGRDKKANSNPTTASRSGSGSNTILPNYRASTSTSDSVPAPSEKTTSSNCNRDEGPATGTNRKKNSSAAKKGSGYNQQQPVQGVSDTEKDSAQASGSVSGPGANSTVITVGRNPPPRLGAQKFANVNPTMTSSNFHASASTALAEARALTPVNNASSGLKTANVPQKVEVKAGSKSSAAVVNKAPSQPEAASQQSGTSTVNISKPQAEVSVPVVDRTVLQEIQDLIAKITGIESLGAKNTGKAFVTATGGVDKVAFAHEIQTLKENITEVEALAAKITDKTRRITVSKSQAKLFSVPVGDFIDHGIITDEIDAVKTKITNMEALQAKITNMEALEAVKSGLDARGCGCEPSSASTSAALPVNSTNTVAPAATPATSTEVSCTTAIEEAAPEPAKKPGLKSTRQQQMERIRNLLQERDKRGGRLSKKSALIAKSKPTPVVEEPVEPEDNEVVTTAESPALAPAQGQTNAATVSIVDVDGTTMISSNVPATATPSVEAVPVQVNNRALINAQVQPVQQHPKKQRRKQKKQKQKASQAHDDKSTQSSNPPAAQVNSQKKPGQPTVASSSQNASADRKVPSTAQVNSVEAEAGPAASNAPARIKSSHVRMPRIMTREQMLQSAQAIAAAESMVMEETTESKVQLPPAGTYKVEVLIPPNKNRADAIGTKLLNKMLSRQGLAPPSDSQSKSQNTCGAAVKLSGGSIKPSFNSTDMTARTMNRQIKPAPSTFNTTNSSIQKVGTFYVDDLEEINSALEEAKEDIIASSSKAAEATYADIFLEPMKPPTRAISNHESETDTTTKSKNTSSEKTTCLEKNPRFEVWVCRDPNCFSCPKVPALNSKHKCSDCENAPVVAGTDDEDDNDDQDFVPCDSDSDSSLDSDSLGLLEPDELTSLFKDSSDIVKPPEKTCRCERCLYFGHPNFGMKGGVVSSNTPTTRPAVDSPINVQNSSTSRMMDNTTASCPSTATEEEHPMGLTLDDQIQKYLHCRQIMASMGSSRGTMKDRERHQICIHHGTIYHLLGIPNPNYRPQGQADPDAIVSLFDETIQRLSRDMAPQNQEFSQELLATLTPARARFDQLRHEPNTTNVALTPQKFSSIAMPIWHGLTRWETVWSSQRQAGGQRYQALFLEFICEQIGHIEEVLVNDPMVGVDPWAKPIGWWWVNAPWRKYLKPPTVPKYDPSALNGAQVPIGPIERRRYDPDEDDYFESITVI